MTSLQKQLAAIASHSHNELDLKARKTAHSQSLLFDPAVASTQSMDLLYQICLQGFEELCAVDGRFLRFSRSLFSPQSRSEDRMQLTAQASKDLDLVLENFLALVSSRLLLRPAVKAVEWLVRRFRVHELNTSATILAFLPHHTSTLFPTVLSVLPKQLPPAFKFLHSYKNTLTSPPLSAIVQQAIHNPNFFTVLNDHVLSVCKLQYHSTALLSLWASATAQAIDTRLSSARSGRAHVQRERTDDLLLQTLAVIDEGLKLRKVPECTLGCYLITVLLVSKTDLDEVTLDALMVAVVSSWSAKTTESGLECAIAISLRKERHTLPSAAVKQALQNNHLAGQLKALSVHQDVRAFAIGLIQGSLQYADQISSADAQSFYREISTANVLTSADLVGIYAGSQDSPGGRTLSSDLQNALLDSFRPGFDVKTSPKKLVARLSSPSVQESLKGGSYQSVDVEATLAALPKVVDLDSFLSTPVDHVYSAFASSFEQLCTTRHGLDGFRNLSAWKARPALCETLYLRVLCSSLSAAARRVAAKEIASHISGAKATQLDLHSLVGLSIAAIGDSDQKVRLAVVGMVRAIAKHPESTALSTSASRHLLGKQEHSLPCWSTNTLRAFVSNFLVSELEECVVDAEHIKRVIKSAMHGSSDHTEAGKSSQTRLKSAQREELYKLLVSHIDLNTDPCVKIKLLSIVTEVNKVSGRPRSAFLLQPFKEWVSAQVVEQSHIRQLQHKQLAKAFVTAVHPRDEDSVYYLLSLCLGSRPGTSTILQHAASRHLVELWPQIRLHVQNRVMNDTLSILATDGGPQDKPEAPDNAEALLRGLTLSSDNLVDMFSHLLSQFEVTDERVAKRRRISKESASAHQEEIGARPSSGLQQLSLGLELVDEAHLDANGDLFHILFRALRVIQTWQSRKRVDGQFLQVLVLKNLLALAKSLQASQQRVSFDTSVVRVDLLVECLKKTSSSQARTAAIGLLSSLSIWIPEGVLHHIIPIFTLMSQTTVRQQDEQSFQIVDRAIQDIIPRLVHTLRERKADVATSTEDIISSFAAAFEHIPHERRLRLFNLLASSLGPEECLHFILMSLAYRWPSYASVERFSALLLRQYPSKVALTSLRNYIDVLVQISEPDSTSRSSSISLPTTDPARSERMSAWLQVLCEMIKDGLIDYHVLTRESKNPDADEMRRLFGQSLEKLLQLPANFAVDEAVKQKCSNALEHLLKLLPFAEFLAAISPLLNPSNENVSRSILKALEVQLRFAKVADAATKQVALRFLPRLTSLVEAEGSALPLRLNAIVCIDRICEDYGKLDLDNTFRAAQIVAGCLNEKDPLMLALALHCLASMVDVLQERYIPLLHDSANAACRCLGGALEQEPKDIRLHNATIALDVALVEHLPFMISSTFLETSMRHMHLSAVSDLKSEANENRVHFNQVTAEKVTVQTVFEANRRTWDLAITSGSSALHESLDLLQSSIDLQPKSEISKHTRILLDSFLSFCDLRRRLTESDSVQAIDDTVVAALERKTINLLITLILKVNDATFRPFFVRLVEWTGDLTQQYEQGKSLRRLTLFNFLHTLSERLKSLVTPYFGYVLETASDILRAVPEAAQATQMTHELVQVVLKSLISGFKHDQDDFYQAPSRFALLHPALLAQLTLHNPAPLTSLTQTHAIPALVAFASAVSSIPDHLTALNTSLLSLLKGHQPEVLAQSGSAPRAPHTNGDVPSKKTTTTRWSDKKTARNGKLAAVMAMRALTRELGEEWLGMLPQMLPIVSELLEDGDERVEGQTEAWVKEMEGVLGESLGEMLA
ncbi:MAG: hypothetical protein Q9159_002125 [Coniocarpon cinnabarinum]